MFTLMPDPDQEEYLTLEQYQERFELPSTRKLADHFGKSQTSIMRWLKHENLFVKVVNGAWQEVYVEKTLAVQGVPATSD